MQPPSAFRFPRLAQTVNAARVRAVSPMIAVTLLAAHPMAALARAGGGQHFGGSAPYGGGHGGGGLFSLWPLLLLGHGSGFGFLIFLLVVYYLYQQSQSRRVGQWPGGGSFAPPIDADPTSDETSLTASPGSPAFDPQAAARGVEAIKAHDPNFDEHAFMDRAETAFFKLQQAWAARNQDLARDVMSSALYERHKMQTDQLIANHQMDVLENIVIGHARIIDAAAGTPYDSIVVAFDAAMTDYTIDERTKQIVDGDANQRRFSERWTFIRRADAKTAAAQTQLASSCPSCGAPLSLENGKCAYCGAFVRSTSSDWVVDSIEQT